MQKREARKQEIRQRLTDACLMLLGEKPLADITINDICQNAGVARQTLYNNFTSKEAILDEISQHVMYGSTLQAFDQALEERQSAADRLAYTFSRVGVPMMDYEGPQQQVFIQLVQNLTLRMSYNPNGLQDFHATARRYFAALAEQADTRDDWQVDFVATLAVTSLVGIVVSWVSDQGFAAQQAIEQLHQHIAGLILA